MLKKQSFLVILFLIALLWLNCCSSGLAETTAKGKVVSKVNFFKADLVAVLQELASECGYNVIVTPEVSGSVTVQLSNVTFEQALQFIMASHNLAFRREGRNFLIGKSGQLAVDQKTIGYFHIDYADAKAVAEIAQKLTSCPDILADERTRMVIVSGTKTQVDQAGKVVALLDRKLAQVAIEVKVVEVSTSALRKLGMQWQVDENSMNWGVTSSGAELILKMITAGHSWSAIFNALAANGQAHLVTSPAVATVDGKEAAILIGDKIPVETKDKDGNVTVSYLEVGVKLIFTPRIQQNNEIAIDLKTQVNSLGEKTGSYYIINAREINSQIQAKIDETVFLGGLISQKERSALQKIPFLGDLPLLGRIFQHVEKSKEETELILTITPKLNAPVNLKNPN